MRKKLKHEIGRLFKTKFLPDYPAQLYDVIAVNKKDGTIVKIGEVSTLKQAVEVKDKQFDPSFHYYLLTNDSILTELPTR